MKTIGITDFLAKRFETYDYEGAWLDSFGKPELNFSALVYGAPGNGKTEFCIQWAKQMAKYTKVYYNSYEQGISESLQTALIRNNMQEVTGKVMFARETYTEMMERLAKPRGPQVVVIDSRDYIGLTDEQYRRMRRSFPRKAFIIICWEQAGKPKGQYAKAIEYMVDIKVHVSAFRAYPRSRFGGCKPYTIWNRKNETTLF